MYLPVARAVLRFQSTSAMTSPNLNSKPTEGGVNRPFVKVVSGRGEEGFIVASSEFCDSLLASRCQSKRQAVAMVGRGQRRESNSMAAP